MKVNNFSMYEVNAEEGTVFSLFSKKFVGHPDNDGYIKLTLTDDNGKQHPFQKHRFIWEAVNGQIPEGYDIHHCDENKENCAISNLSCVSHKTNCNLGTRNERAALNRDYQEIGKKLSKRVGAFQNDVLVMTFPSIREAGRSGYHSGEVSACCRGKLKTHKGYKWKYLN